MRCEFCGTDPDLVVIVPVRLWDGRLQTIACLDCAHKSGTYCERHVRPHLGFDDGSHACILCIEEKVRKNADLARDTARLFKESLPWMEYLRIQEWAATIAPKIGDDWRNCILRAIVTRAFRRNIHMDAVLDQIIAQKSAEIIVPHEVTDLMERGLI